jgi:hypothetical protein
VEIVTWWLVSSVERSMVSPFFLAFGHMFCNMIKLLYHGVQERHTTGEFIDPHACYREIDQKKKLPRCVNQNVEVYMIYIHMYVWPYTTGESSKNSLVGTYIVFSTTKYYISTLNNWSKNIYPSK